MDVCNTCKYNYDRIKVSRKSGDHITSFCESFSHSRGANSAVCYQIWPNFELIHDITHSSITCKFKQGRINIKFNLMQVIMYICPSYLQILKGSDLNQSRKSGDTLFPIICLWGNFQTLKAAYRLRIWLNFKIIQATMYFIVTSY